MESILEVQMVTYSFSNYSLPTKKKVIDNLFPSNYPTWELIDILIVDTVEAYENGELAELLGIDEKDVEDLWAKYVKYLSNFKCIIYHIVHWFTWTISQWNAFDHIVPWFLIVLSRNVLYVFYLG